MGAGAKGGPRAQGCRIRAVRARKERKRQGLEEAAARLDGANSAARF